MFPYELTILLPTKEELSTVKKIIADNGGIIKEEKSWGERKLAYKIKKFISAYYYHLEFNLKEKKVLSKLKKQLNFNENIIRYLLLVKQK